ncbi:MAG: LTA synthase family protein [Lachnospiraceae bacterium]|nr:LTA synthase family protein [Lachnospiraceae bacterium]
MYYLLTILLIPYYEAIFRISTTRDFGIKVMILSALVSAGYGCIFSLLMRLTKNPKINKGTTGTVLFVLPIIYLVEFFVYRSFKVFYDPNTIINGAGGVAAGFKADAARLIFCFDGLTRIFLFLLPFLMYVLFIKRKDSAPRHRIKQFLGLIAGAVILIGSTNLFISRDEGLFSMCDSEYNYQNVVESLGLSTGLRLDVQRKIKGKEEGFVFEFTDVSLSGSALKPDRIGLPSYEATGSYHPSLKEDITPVKKAGLLPVSELLPEPEPVVKPEIPEYTTIAEVNPEEEPEPIEPVEPPMGEWAEYYGVNTLDIDFNALAESTSGTMHDLDIYVSSIKPSSKNKYTSLFKGKNLIFFSAEAFSGDIIDPELTPTLYRLSTKGIQIPDYYQPAIAGTTGGEYANLFGMIPSLGGKSMKSITDHNTWITIGNRLNDEGYYGKAYHNNDGSVYGRNNTHNKLGYSDGFMAVGSGMEEFLTSTGFPQSDLEMMEGTLPTYIDKQPFNVYYMTVSGHGQYGRNKNRMSAKNYERVENLEYSEIVKCYIANNLELEDALTYTVNELEKAGIADDTVIVLGADHFPYSLDYNASLGNMPALSELYGYNVTNYIQRDHNRLIIWSGCLEKEDPIIVNDPVFSLDILPTLCNLFGVDFDSRLLPGRDIFSDREALIFTGGYDWKTSLGTYIAKKNEFTPTDPDADIPEDYVERIKAEVRNRMNYSKSVLSCGYFDHVFGPAN